MAVETDNPAGGDRASSDDALGETTFLIIFVACIASANGLTIQRGSTSPSRICG